MSRTTSGVRCGGPQPNKAIGTGQTYGMDGTGQQVRLAVLDAGSNSAHLLVADLVPGQPPTGVHSAKWPTRLAEDTDSGGNIRPAAISRLTTAVAEAGQAADAYGAAGLIAYATSAIRDAANRDQVTAEVRRDSGVRLDILPGGAEARLEFLAVRRWHGWSAGPLLLLDIGGGSFEIAFGEGERPSHAVSLPLGAGRLANDFLRSDPPRKAELRKLRQHVVSVLAQEAKGFPTVDDMTAVATSRTFARLARLSGAPKQTGTERVPGRLDAAVLRARLPKLASRTDAKRAKLKGISHRRARQLLAGAVVADAAMTVLDLPYVEICPWALREGVLLQHASIPATSTAQHRAAELTGPTGVAAPPPATVASA